MRQMIEVSVIQGRGQKMFWTDLVFLATHCPENRFFCKISGANGLKT